MANYYTLASLVAATKLSPKEQAWILNEIKIEDAILDVSEETRDVWAKARGIPDADFGFGFRLSIVKNDTIGPYMWLSYDENFNVENACAFLQHWLHTMRPDEAIGFEYTNTCSKPRPDGFGGGAVFVTKDDIKTTHSYSWLIEREKEHAEGKR
ncbi:MAG: hypothetical protein DRJ03_16835 [Chloroflexi bacterium]|nr:MAG: hypothetical protein DRJ03_16835 [Chloroflexota bacterium]